ncbi:MAG TPA: radical SAM protein [Bacteroidales bacterium]|nr:radical SAM protein [Bacteroidales bacterium]
MGSKIKKHLQYYFNRVSVPFARLKQSFVPLIYPPNDAQLASHIKDYNKHRPYGPQKLICYVPQNSLVFFRDGRVLPCSYNQTYEFGKYPENSVKEIIEGERRRAFIAMHYNNDLSQGCSYCRNFIASGKYNGVKSMSFDRYSFRKKPWSPAVMEFDISSHCNLRCIMCNERMRSVEPPDSPYNDQFIGEITPYLLHIKEAKFFGREPFTIQQYYKIWDIITTHNPRAKIFVITNGTNLNEEIKALLNKGRFEIGVSVDSLNKEKFEKIRKGARFETVIENLHWFNSYCKSKNTCLSVSMTIFRENWQDIPDILRFCNKYQCSVFFSYLYKPEILSLWTLPTDEILSIYQYLKEFSFSRNNAIEVYNSKCYAEIIEHLNYWAHPPDRKKAWEGRLSEYIQVHKSIRKTEAETLSHEISKSLEKVIIESGYKKHLPGIYQELLNIDMGEFLLFYYNQPKEMWVEQLDLFIKKLNL